MSTPPPGDATLSIAHANAIALAWLPATALVVLAPFALAWGTGALGAGFLRLTPLPVLLPGFVGSVVLHEGLHAVGFLAFGRVQWRAVRFGLHRRTLTPYATCRAAVNASAYRGAALLPALALGLVPALLGIALGIGWLAVWAALMLALAGGDLAAVWAIRRLPADALVLDHPTRVGCTVVAAARPL